MAGGTVTLSKDSGGIAALQSRSEAAIFLLDDDGVLVDVNDAACALLQMQRQEVIGLSYDKFRGRDYGPERFRQLLDAGAISGRSALARPDGSELDCVISASANVAPGSHLVVMTPEKGAMWRKWTEAGPAARDCGALTDRERQVMTLLALGETCGSIAERLTLSPETVRNHSRSARLRLGARSRSHAIALALEMGEIELEGPDLNVPGMRLATVG